MQSTRKPRLVRGALAAAAALSLTLVGCTTTPTTDTGTEKSSGTSTISIAQVNELTSFNWNVPGNSLDTNQIVNFLTQPQFFTLDQNFQVVPNTDLGTYEQVSSDPLRVSYTLNEGLKWSDGEPITADDLMLGWAAISCYYNSDKSNESGDIVSGTAYFASANGCLFKTELPEISDDNLTITFSYAEPYVDWKLVNPIQMPAHVVAAEIGVTTETLTEALLTTPAGDKENPAEPNETLEKAAKFLMTGYDATALPTNENILVSGGPLMVSDWTPTQSLTLVPNPEYAGEHSVQFDKLVIRFIADANAQVTALQNGEVDVIQPQASADTLLALEGAANVTTIVGDKLGYDHLDLNFRSEVFSDLEVRQAFLLTIPRNEILQAIVTPVNPDAEVVNSQVLLPSQIGYDETVAQNGHEEYDDVNIDKAKQLLAGRTPSVKILYNSQNPNRVDAFQAIQASAAQAGITVVDGGSPQWGTLLTGGDYDASIFGWTPNGANNVLLAQMFQIGNGSNYSGYNVQASSDLAEESQRTVDPERLTEIKHELDKLAFENAYGLPLFQNPGLFGVSDKVNGIEHFGGQVGVVWNIWEWTK